jgi:hypothetical protein
MPPNFEPTTAIDAYKAIIDQLVDETSNGVSERLLRESGIYTKAQGESAANEFAQSLTEQQRELLATMLRQERVGAIHDVLTALTWWRACREVGWTFRGITMPFDLHGMGMHGDYIGRLDDLEWPSENRSD